MKKKKITILAVNFRTIHYGGRTAISGEMFPLRERETFHHLPPTSISRLTSSRVRIYTQDPIELIKQGCKKVAYDVIF